MREISRFWIFPIVLLAVWVVPNRNSARPKSAATAGMPDNLPDWCPVTKPPSPAFIPPAPYPSDPPSDTFWLDTEKLWTLVAQTVHDIAGVRKLNGLDCRNPVS
jgi:hypothetical protein